MAGFGIGLSGGLPIPPSNKREDKQEIEISVKKKEEGDKELKP